MLFSRLTVRRRVGDRDCWNERIGVAHPIPGMRLQARSHAFSRNSGGLKLRIRDSHRSCNDHASSGWSFGAGSNVRSVGVDGVRDRPRVRRRVRRESRSRPSTENDAPERGGLDRAGRRRSRVPVAVDRITRRPSAGRGLRAHVVETRTRRRLHRCRARRGGEGRVSPRAALHSFSRFFPGNAAVGIRVGLREATVELLPLLGSEREGFILFGDAVPKLLDEFDLLGRGELKEFLAKGVRRHGCESAVGLAQRQVVPWRSPLYPLAASSAARIGRRQPIRRPPNRLGQPGGPLIERVRQRGGRFRIRPLIASARGP